MLRVGASRGILRLLVVVATIVPIAAHASADDSLPPSVEKLVEKIRPSVVVITFAGRDGQREGLGTGFVVGSDGLIATNLHVIGEARPISVETADGKRHEVTVIEASDRAADLALVRINAGNLPALGLGDSDSLKQGQPIVAVGNPHGLAHSVVTGVVSAQREIDGRPVIQVAIPIEPGNSGGPLLDLEGRVHGLLTMKSQVTANLGFAVPINRLKPLIDNPNPVPMNRWVAIGAPDPAQWKPLFGGRWRQKAGKLLVEGPGQGFGGRTLCIAQQDVPETPYELAVSVRLDNEAGAAGLIFASDGGNRHFGFYPSAGKLRLTQFDGPDVTTWHVLEERPSPHYLPGEWNTIKVRVESDKVACYVNGHLLIESTRAQPNPGQAGVAKFRDTRAEFKDFQLAKEILQPRVDEVLSQRVDQWIDGLPSNGEIDAETVEKFTPDGQLAVAALRDKARQLDQQAAKVRQLATAIYEQRVLAELSKELEKGDDEIDLVRGALLIARLDNDELDVAAYCNQLARLCGELKSRVPAEADAAARLDALDDFLFNQQGFHGSRGDYYNHHNGYLNDVLDDREGLPIMLSLIYRELAQHIGLAVDGIGLPGHFIVAWKPEMGETVYIDVFDRGRRRTLEQVHAKVLDVTGQPLSEEDLKPVSKRSWLMRVVRSLQSMMRRSRDMPGMLRYLDAVLTISPDSAEDRMYRALFRYQTGQGHRALVDIDWLLAHEPPGIDLPHVSQLRDAILNRGEN